MNNLKRGPQLRQPQPLLYITTTGTGGQRTRRHWAWTHIWSSTPALINHTSWAWRGILSSNRTTQTNSINRNSSPLSDTWNRTVRQYDGERPAGRLHTGLLCASSWTLSDDAGGLWDLQTPKIAIRVLFCHVFPRWLAVVLDYVSGWRRAYCECNTVLMFVHYEYIPFGKLSVVVMETRNWNIRLMRMFVGLNVTVTVWEKVLLNKSCRSWEDVALEAMWRDP